MFGASSEKPTNPRASRRRRSLDRTSFCVASRHEIQRSAQRPFWRAIALRAGDVVLAIWLRFLTRKKPHRRRRGDRGQHMAAQALNCAKNRTDRIPGEKLTEQKNSRVPLARHHRSGRSGGRLSGFDRSACTSNDRFQTRPQLDATPMAIPEAPRQSRSRSPVWPPRTANLSV